MNHDLDELMRTMQDIWRIIMHQHKGSFDYGKITVLQIHTLRFLRDAKNATMTDLAKQLKITISSATQLVERLFQLGLVSRKSDKKDRRLIHLLVTKKGKSQLDHFRKRKMEQMKKIFSKIPLQDLKELLRIQKGLLKTLKKQ